VDRNLIRSISEKIFSLFVVNTAAAGIQQKDGKYITKYIPVTPSLIENMIMAKGSMGCYQQGYKTGYLKWICLDFDCKDKINPNVRKLYHDAIAPVTLFLDRAGIHYLTEFSGRRGIHIWIVFDHIIKKSLGYRILYEILRRVPINLAEEENEWNLDLFPATDSSKNNTVGKQVKFPLSTHRAGGMAFFFQSEFDYCADLGSDRFFSEQYSILSNYIENNVETVMASLGLEKEYAKAYAYKFKKYRISNHVDVSVDDLWTILCETKVFDAIHSRIKKGQALPRDWTVILGTLSPCDSEAKLVRAVLREFPNYDEEKTADNIQKYKGRYFPATFEYLYFLYDLEMEKGLCPQMTGYSYLCKRLGIPEQEEILDESNQANGNCQTIQDTINKEIDYLLYNDESPDIYIWNQLHLMKNADKQELLEIVDTASKTGSFDGTAESFRVYNRIESEEKTRRLISLSARERIVTTHLSLELCKEYRQRWKSFSYHPALTSRRDIFYDWFRSWGRYIERISTYLEVPFFEDYEILFIDLKKFYDHIDFLTVYKTLQADANEKASNILRYLIAYNDSLMSQANAGSRIGVPQGPAYARIIAEFFLNKILSDIERPYKGDINIMRYVDDITIICNPGFDSKSFFRELCGVLSAYGLPVNMEKSICYGSIGKLTDGQKRDLLHTDHFNYDLRSNYRGEVTLLMERRRNLRHYLEDHSFDMRSLGYIFGSQTMMEAKEWCFEQYRTQIIQSEIGRGSNFRRFYKFLFQHEAYLSVVLSERLLDQIPIPSVNFSNFIDTLYLAVQEKEIASQSFERIKKEYFPSITEVQLEGNDLAVLNALRMIKMEGKSNEP